MNTDKHGLIGRAGSPLPAVRQNTMRGAHGLSRRSPAMRDEGGSDAPYLRMVLSLSVSIRG
jgi:hypothetical protein